MNKVDFAQVVERINALAEVYGTKPPTQKAIEMWFGLLQSFTTGDVLGALDDWGRSKPKMPTPADIVQLASARLSDRLEQQAASDKAVERREIMQMRATPHGLAVLDGIRKVLAKAKPPPQKRPVFVRERVPGEDDE